MNKQRVLILLFLFICLSALFGLPPRNAEAASRGGYQINSYDCYYKVEDNNIYHVVETINVTFTEYRHGIYRYIPEVNHIKRLDGSTDTVISEVKVTSCSDQYTDDRVVNDRMIKIGDPDTEIIGNHTYTITYDVIWGNDRVEGADEFYMNLIGDGWDVPVNNLTFTIEMPKEFQDTGDNIGFYYGAYGESKIEGIRYSFDGKILRGSLVGYYIEPGSFFTTRILLEDGYFVETFDSHIDAIVALVFCCLFLAISLIIWMKVGRDDDVISVVEFYPPDGLNCGEMAYAYYGKVENKDIVPMVISLASKGYVQIIQNDENGRDFSFRINIEKDYEGSDKSEYMFLQGLKKYGNVVTKQELTNSFYKTLDKVNKQIVNDFESKIFIKNTLIWRYVTFILAFIPYFAGLFLSVRRFSGEAFHALLAPALFFVVVSLLTLFVSSKKVKIALRIFMGVVFLVALGFLIYIYSPGINYAGMIYWVVLGASIIANVIQMVFFRIIDKRTEYGIDLYSRIKGFRNYLNTVEKPHLIALVNQDPSYFYKILPYTYVLGVTDIWVEKFESIALKPPGWFREYGYHQFNYRSFNSFMRRTMTSTQTAMTSSPHSSGSGGGFSGGGGGGGGGGSW